MGIRDGLLALGIVVVCCGLAVAVTYPAPTQTLPSLTIAGFAMKTKHEQEKAMRVVVTVGRNSLDVKLEKVQ